MIEDVEVGELEFADKRESASWCVETLKFWSYPVVDDDRSSERAEFGCESVVCLCVVGVGGGGRNGDPYDKFVG